jgi:hypothetical protein
MIMPSRAAILAHAVQLEHSLAQSRAPLEVRAIAMRVTPIGVASAEREGGERGERAGSDGGQNGEFEASLQVNPGGECGSDIYSRGWSAVPNILSIASGCG